MALYRFAVNDDRAALKHDYPLIYKSVTQTTNLCLTDSKGNPIGVTQHAAPPSTPTNLTLVTSFMRCATGLGSSGGGPTITQGSQSVSSMVVDPYYLKVPLCILCG